MTQAIVVEDVTKTYGDVLALDGLSLQVEEGEIFGLLGANGAGKTTLIKILVGALKPDTGHIRVMGYDPVKQKYEIRPRVGYMPQQLALYDDLSAHENVSFFGTARQIPNLKKRVNEVLELLGLEDRINDPVHEFSGGMKQRVSLACALVHQPKLLLLDEPTTGVDPKLRESLWTHFHELTKQGVTILISTHQMDEAFHCNRVAVMRGGMALATDTPRGLMARGHAQVKVWRNGSTETHDMENYRDDLPQLLGIRGQVDKIEIEEDTLEDVVLNLIAEKEVSHA